ncbi:CheC, inhibitor of MCP methylation [Desulfofarcimen acetoxidans DSM 771]|uniref:CheC, inhibitor of MCP methylation n=1 Tax=Desulfofarcimen acetoxidans (strain ATCC 49208 / DSM 771 / KCTC 5769 / VKM B-1644 / 5575) TaxID=485916 RepID=C8VX76_DESAS|nr:flagellar motor switch phosphatase FliY [Desulfofarcimen acetoxidans]ACV64472.1 CheC, inhibitor of MCP methylation [Desulfofarcimen acetoxidans DSM 771]
MSHRELSQAEIDALFERYNNPVSEDFSSLLSHHQLDTIGEVGNISMGTAATTLSQILNQRVTIGNPRVIVCKQEEVFKSFATPYLLVYVSFKEGLTGFNVLIITENEVATIANLMLGGDGNIPPVVELSELEISAAQEAMNQMIGSVCTAMTDMFGIPIDITPPTITMVHDIKNASLTPLPTEQPVVVVRFDTFISNILKTTIMQILSVDAAQEEANYLLQKAGYMDKEAEIVANNANSDNDQVAVASKLPNLTAALSLPVNLTVVLGKTLSTVEELARLEIGKKLTLPLSAECVEIYAGDTLVGKGKLIDQKGKMQVEINQLSMPNWKLE